MQRIVKRKITSRIREATLSEKELFALEELLFDLIIITYLSGMVQVDTALDGASLSFAEKGDAAAALADRLALPPEVYKELSAQAHFRAFSAARCAGLDSVKRLQKHLERSLSRGQSMRQWVKTTEHDKILRDIGFHKENPYYLETVFRTNANNSYNGGKYRRIQERANDIFALEYRGIPDDRQTDLCKRLDGTRLPPEHKFWKKYFPPNHYNERSTAGIISKTRADAEHIALKNPPKGRVKIKKEFRSHPNNWWKLTRCMVKKLAAYGEKAVVLEELAGLAEDIPVFLKYLAVLKAQFNTS